MAKPDPPDNTLWYAIGVVLASTVLRPVEADGSRLARLSRLICHIIRQTLSDESQFPRSRSHYIRLLSVKDVQARAFYETEAI